MVYIYKSGKASFNLKVCDYSYPKGTPAVHIHCSYCPPLFPYIASLFAGSATSGSLYSLSGQCDIEDLEVSLLTGSSTVEMKNEEEEMLVNIIIYMYKILSLFTLSVLFSVIISKHYVIVEVMFINSVIPWRHRLCLVLLNAVVCLCCVLCIYSVHVTMIITTDLLFDFTVVKYSLSKCLVVT